VVSKIGGAAVNGGALPFVLLFAAVGLALTRAPSKMAWLSVAGLCASALLFAMFTPPERLQGVLFMGLWLSMIVTATAVLIGRSIPAPFAIAVAVNAGAWAGLLAAASGLRLALTFALPISLLFVAGKWLKHSSGIVPKVLSSWLIAVGTLAMLVALVPTPGYEADHIE
jgi:hypothetical protein